MTSTWRMLAAVLGSILLISTAWASIRINGNQLVESSDSYYGSVAAARNRAAGSAAAGRPGYLLFNLGQGLTGHSKQFDAGATGAIRSVGLGLIFDVNNVAYENYCPIDLTGDVNLTGSITSADIIYLVGFVFKGAAAPLPCQAAGDVNVSGSVTSADIIYLVSFVFKGGLPPTDVCFAIPGVWSCP